MEVWMLDGYLNSHAEAVRPAYLCSYLNKIALRAGCREVSAAAFTDKLCYPT